MKDLKQFINESMKFDGSTKVSMGDSAALSKFIKDEVEDLEGTLKVSGDGIKYDNMLVPGTKLSLGLTADEYVDIFIDWLNNLNDKKANAKPAKLGRKKLKTADEQEQKTWGKPRDKEAEERRKEKNKELGF